ncbi:DUF4870 domain-containing protein [uncultured Paenibacillus sp.]|uniref:DUF4870 domain-containing protein n=1 Tax=uncultured Paenibacillus sp. TaxID=227322 RepID=UPI0028D10B86|nr:DUF4870 domain-containing protein [uncultured Paenibacillus sp.]
MSEPYVPKSSTGLDPKLVGLLCYLLGFVTGILFLAIEKDSKFVKFHALQSTLLSLSLIVIHSVLGFIPIIGWLLGLILGPLTLILWFACMLLAVQGRFFKLPLIGDLAERQAGKL